MQTDIEEDESRYNCTWYANNEIQNIGPFQRRHHQMFSKRNMKYLQLSKQKVQTSTETISNSHAGKENLPRREIERTIYLAVGKLCRRFLVLLQCHGQQKDDKEKISGCSVLRGKKKSLKSK
ncbi:hypothetical protein NPIL_125141 [Nephila pilipes]|uniref:Uncharacterized protein n=1 Tax=Nephila pilipes TaxID=299642 RepID=A0A8X6NH05_NEPPI|nr:hypothetical protein NPIL_125141 [Nephila pilipes]